MTTPSITASQTQFGQVLAFAERTLTEHLRQQLAERQIVPETWYALKLIGTGGPGLARAALIRDLTGSRSRTAESVRELLARLETEGLIHGADELDLTADGQALYRSLREYVLGSTAKLLGQFDDADIDTTVRTLRAITERAVQLHG